MAGHRFDRLLWRSLVTGRDAHQIAAYFMSDIGTLSPRNFPDCLLIDGPWN